MNDKIKTEMAIRATNIAHRLMDAAFYLCGTATDSEEYLLKAMSGSRDAAIALGRELKIADDSDTSLTDSRLGSNLSLGLEILKDAGDMIDDFKRYIDELVVSK